MARVVVEAAQDFGAAVDERHLRAEPMKDAGEFNRDIARALDYDMARQPRKLERFVREDDELGARDIRFHGMPAGRYQNGPGAYARAGFQDADGVRVFDYRARLDNLDARAVQGRMIGSFQPRDLFILVSDQRRPVELRARDRPAEANGILEIVREAACVDEQFLGNAAADHAGAADAIFLGDHHPRAVACRDARGAYA